MQAAENRTHMPSGATPRRLESIVLNDINAEIFGGLVRINVLLDAKGLDKLERKIQALRMLIEDDGANEGNQQNKEWSGEEPDSDDES